MQMALEALEHSSWCVQNNYLPDQCGHDWDNAITAMREALNNSQVVNDKNNLQVVSEKPQGEWVDLTDGEIEAAFTGSDLLGLHQPQLKAIYSVIAKFKEKNTPKVVPQGEPVAFLAEATRFKVTLTERDCCIKGLPRDLGGRWVALVAAEDDCHMRYTTPPSVEAAIKATKEKAAKVCDGIDQRDDIHPDHVAIECAAAIRSMK